MEERERRGRFDEEEVTSGNPIHNVPIKGVAGWIISLLLAAVIFFFWQNKEANERIMLAESKRADKAELNSNYWRDKYFNCTENMNSLSEITKQFGVIQGNKALQIVPKHEE